MESCQLYIIIILVLIWYDNVHVSVAMQFLFYSNTKLVTKTLVNDSDAETV